MAPKEIEQQTDLIVKFLFEDEDVIQRHKEEMCCLEVDSSHSG